MNWRMGRCPSRMSQSPIDLPAHAGPPVGEFYFSYQPVDEPFDMQNNGHTLSADLSMNGYGGVTYGGVWYTLLSVSIHAESEHTWGGSRKPVELHLVHKRYDSDALLVVALPLQSPTAPTIPPWVTNSSAPAPTTLSPTSYVPPPGSDPGFNPVVQVFLRTAPPAFNAKTTIHAHEVEPLELNMLLQGSSFFEYAGSMTAPPCSETVLWLVRAVPIIASDAQVGYLKNAIFSMTSGTGNYREVMPRNGRPIAVKIGVLDPAPPTPSVPPPFIAGPPPAPRRADDALTLAKRAVQKAMSAMDNVRNLEDRLETVAVIAKNVPNSTM